MNLKYVLDIAVKDAAATGPFTSKIFEDICYQGVGAEGSMQDAAFRDGGIISAIFHFSNLKATLAAYRRVLTLQIKESSIMYYVLNEDGTENERETLTLESEVVADAVDEISRSAMTLTGGDYYRGMASAAMAASTLAIYNSTTLEEIIELISVHYKQASGNFGTTDTEIHTNGPRGKA